MTEDDFLTQHQDDLKYFNITNEDYLNIISQLPDKKYYEYIFHKFYKPTADFEIWHPWDIWNYPVKDALRFKYILLDNLKYIKNYSVADFSCFLGYTSMFMSYLGAKNVTGTDVRDRELNLSRELCKISNTDNVKFIKSNIHDYEDVQKICNLHDTILLSGIIYHLTDQINILESITNSTATTLIIDNCENIDIKDKKQPLIAYKIERIDISVNGYIDKPSSTSMIVGNPNQSWIDFTMTYLGWTKVYNRAYQMNRDSGGDGLRCVSTWTRNI